MNWSVPPTASHRSIVGLNDAPSGAAQFRVEINQQYTTRYQELLMVHVHDTGDVPPGNKGKPMPKLGRLSPS